MALARPLPGTGTRAGEGVHAAWVRQMYRDIMGREPDPDGMAYWAAALNSGVHSRSSSYQALVRSSEGVRALKARVREQYRQVFGREPESEEVVNYWVNRIQAGELGVTSGEIASAFKQTPEYAGGPQNMPNIDQPGGTTEEGQPTIGEGGGVEAPEIRNVDAELEVVLDRYGLSSLLPGMTELIQSGELTNDRAVLWIYDQPEFKERFPALEIQRNAGVGVMTPEEYLQYETNAMAIFRDAGLPANFYDDASDFTEIIGQGISTVELKAHLQQGFARVVNAPPEVRARFAEFFGAQGDSALAAYMLDFDRASEVLANQIAAAEVAGFGDVMGIGINQATATQLAELGYEGRNSIQQFGQVVEQGALFDESISETQDFTAEEEGVGAAFGVDPDAAERLERRRAGRIGALSGGGGLLTTEQGIGGTAGQ